MAEAAAPSMEPDLVMWTVYDRAPDFPGHFVARKWVLQGTIVCATGSVIACRQIVLMREWLRRRGFFRTPRQPADDPRIVEVWL